jgi:hypothetical protein
MSTERAAAATPSTVPPAPPPEDWHNAVTHRRPTPSAAARDDTAWRVRALAAERRAEAAEQHVLGLETALGSRPAIDQAKGVIMAVYGLGADEAFQSLVRVSQHANVKLADIAEQLLSDIRTTDLGPQASEALTRALARLSGLPRE